MLLGEELRNMLVETPFRKKNVPIVFDEQIRPRIGSAINPVAPSHFIDDMKIAQVIETQIGNKQFYEFILFS